MVSLSPEEMQSVANELNYHFFVCDTHFTRWQYLSIPLLRLLELSEEEFETDPEAWMSRVCHPSETPPPILEGLKSMGEKNQLKLPLCGTGGEEIRLKIRFSSVIEFQNGELCRLGSVEVESEDYKYKKEALKARDNEIEISARIQRILLTSTGKNDFDDLEIAAETIPSRAVDGDFYEFLQLAPGLSDFIIGDVMGKGVPAALLAAAIKASYYKSLITSGISRTGVPEIGTILTNMDALISKNLMELKKFLTLYYCRVNTAASMLNFIDAGHTCFIYYDAAEGSCWSVKGSNMPIGFSGTQEYRTYMMPFDRDDLFFFYSDGISEVMNSEGDVFGFERIGQLVGAHSYLSADELLKKVLNVTFFFAADSFKDDVTGVAIRIKKKRKDPAIEAGRTPSVEGKLDLETVRRNFSGDLQKVYSREQQTECSKLTIALMEACANCVSFAISDISVSWQIYPERTIATVHYSGPDFNWFQAREPEIESYQKSGFGLYLIRQGTDSSLLLQGSNDQKKLILVKEFPCNPN